VKTLLDMLAAGGRALRRHAGLVAGLYAIQLLISAVVGAVVATALVPPFARRPIFDAAVDGDLHSLVVVLSDHADLLLALAWLAVAVALLYGVLSWFLTGGLLAVIADSTSPLARGARMRTFGAGSAALFLPFARLWIWSLIPYGLIATVLALGLLGFHDTATSALTFGDVLWPFVGAIAPAVLLWVLLTTFLDYARIELLRTPGLGSGWALLRAAWFVVRRPIAIAHVLLYFALSVGVVAGYVGLTWNRPMLGAAGAVALFAARQLAHALRFSLRVGLLAGQVRFRRQ